MFTCMHTRALRFEGAFLVGSLGSLPKPGNNLSILLAGEAKELNNL